MKLSDYTNDYYEFSGKASDGARKLAFAGIALVWIFKIEAGPVPKIPEELVFPCVLLALTLLFDLLQYVAGTLVWGAFQYYHEGRLNSMKEDPELDAPTCFKWPQLFFFVSKLCTVLLAYFFIIGYIYSVWFKTKG